MWCGVFGTGMMVMGYGWQLICEMRLRNDSLGSHCALLYDAQCGYIGDSIGPLPRADVVGVFNSLRTQALLIKPLCLFNMCLASDGLVC